MSPSNKAQIDKVLASALEMEMNHVVETLRKARKRPSSEVRFIMGNSNFLLDKVVDEAQKQYTRTTNLECTELRNLRNRYHAKIKSVVDG